MKMDLSASGRDGLCSLRHSRLGVGRLLMLAAVGLCATGCSLPATSIKTPNRVSQGYVVILPGIEGASLLNSDIAKGLADGGVPSSIEVYDWTTGSWLLAGVNLRFYWRNEREARKIVNKIVSYQDMHPGKPVHLIGHSAGGGVAVLVLENLPANRQITSAILLAPAIAPDYDLRRALRRTQFGIYNYYSSYDVGWLKAGTTIMGTVDGSHCSAAGAVGFTAPWGLDQEDRRLYAERLHQQRYTRQMAASGHTGGHLGWANRKFVAEWLAPVLDSQIVSQARYASDARLGIPSPRGY
jgi:pimeloyl-ACP methyl ester carboxylesterase